MNMQKLGVIRPFSDKFTAIIRTLDIYAIILTLWGVLYLFDLDWEIMQPWWLLIAVVSFVFFSGFNDLYRQSRGMSLSVEAWRILFAWLNVLLVITFLDQFYPLIQRPYKVVFFAWASAVPVVIWTLHIIIRNIANTLRKMGKHSHRVAIVGATRIGSELQNIFLQEQSMGLKLIGFFDDRQNRDDDGREMLVGQPLAGNLQQLVQRARAGDIDVIYITLALRAEKRIKHLIEQLADSTVSVYYVPDLFVFDLLRSSLHHIRGIPVVSIYDTPFYGIDGMVKRIFDFIIGSLILVVIMVPMLIIAICIKLTSPGPAIFKQLRYGFKGEPIEVWKFRSMNVLENDGSIKQAIKNDPRITKFGMFLRRTSLDELPQFFNVLQGRMSIVGPRPHAVAHNELYRGQIQGYMLRHKVKPGITGLAQISGYRGETDTIEKMQGRIRYDLEYIRNWSLLLDVKIILLTIAKGFINSKAY